MQINLETRFGLLPTDDLNSVPYPMIRTWGTHTQIKVCGKRVTRRAPWIYAELNKVRTIDSEESSSRCPQSPARQRALVAGIPPVAIFLRQR